jgi:hypothetical protein
MRWAAESEVSIANLHMYRAGGTTSIERDRRLARCWRDLHVIGQHANVMPEFYPLSGRVFLGLDPGPKLS